MIIGSSMGPDWIIINNIDIYQRSEAHRSSNCWCWNESWEITSCSWSMHPVHKSRSVPLASRVSSPADSPFSGLCSTSISPEQGIYRLCSCLSVSRVNSGSNPKYPTWDRWLDYHLRVELRADGMKQEELPFLGPRLASNLSCRAFDAISDIEREKLRKEEGWKYLLDFFAKEKVDLLGDAFNEFFVKRSIYRKDGEEFVGYEPPFKMLIRKLEKALKEPGSQGQIPSELFGWYLLNSYMRMEPSDVANVRERAESYKLDHVISALQKMWSGGGLAAKDQESKMKKKKNAASPALRWGGGGDADPWALWGSNHVPRCFSMLSQWSRRQRCSGNVQRSSQGFGQSQYRRGFYLTSNPNAPRYNSGMRKGYGTAGSSNPDANKDCMRCGKRGHIARIAHRNPRNEKGMARAKCLLRAGMHLAIHGRNAFPCGLCSRRQRRLRQCHWCGHLPVRKMLNMKEHEILRITKAIYGLLNTPKQWFEALSSFLVEDGWIPHGLDKWVEDGVIQGVWGIHVDDVLCGGKSKSYESALDRLQNRFSFGSWSNTQRNHHHILRYGKRSEVWW